MDRAITCVYHRTDLDGECSAAIIKFHHPQTVLIGKDYGDSLEDLVIDPESILYVVDFRFPMPMMVELDLTMHNAGGRFIWIDHHESAIDEATKCGFNPEGSRVAGKAACQLVWEFLYPDRRVPKAVRLLGEYDVWNLSDSQTLQFQFGMRAHDTRPENQQWWAPFLGSRYSVLQSASFQQVMRDGQAVTGYVQNSSRKWADTSYVKEWNGLRFLVINQIGLNSQAFEPAWDPEKHDVMLAFHWNGDHWKYSIFTYKTNLDLREIAVPLGGGGHLNAAGFTSKELLEEFAP